MSSRITLYAIDERLPKKLRRITIFKEEVYKDIERLTYKHVEASNIESPKQQNAISADTMETLDGGIIARHVEFRDAQLRRLMQAFLDERCVLEADDVLDLEKWFVYFLKVDTGFNDAMMQPLASHIHRFLVWGALYDWYAEIGSAQANVYGQELDNIEDDILNILRTPSRAKRPLQPFGPAKRYI